MIRDHLLQEADRCVKCGLCLPHCPTYQLYRDEAESPRGRISLIQAVASGALEADQRLMAHLDHCLLCRRCEGACPSDVRYGSLLDMARSDFPRSIPKWLPDQLSQSSNHGVRLRIGSFLGRMGVNRLMLAGVTRKLLDVAKSSDAAWRPLSLYPALSETRGKVALFTGCVGPAFDRVALESSIRLLTMLGFVVSVPPAQSCCGGAHAHAGYRDEANELEKRNLAAFNGKGFDAIVTASSGCGIQLMDHGAFDAPVYEISAFLQEKADFSNLDIGSVQHRIAVHSPCTLHAMKQQKQMFALLEALPGIELSTISGSGCCGGAGLNMIVQSEQAVQIARPLMNELSASGADTLLTTNVGCAMHMRERIADAGLAVTVMHPVELIAEYLEKQDEPSLFTRRSTGFGA